MGVREIRFRAWFPDKKLMDIVAMHNVYPGNKSYMYLSPMPMSDYEPIKLMQWTGLKDKNGNGIYDGDIVINTGPWHLPSTIRLQYSRKSYGEGEMFVVHHNITGFELRHKDDWIANKTKEFVPNGYNAKPYVDNYDFWNLHRALKVVGNIYENPELLNNE